MRGPESRVVAGPDAKVLKALTGTVSEPQTVNRYNDRGELVGEETARFVESGLAMIGHSNWKENRDWGNLFNHYVKVTGAAVILGGLLRMNGQNVNSRLLYHGGLFSHGARRLWDEARFHLDSVPDAEKKKEMRDTRIAVEYLKQKRFPQRFIEVVAVHGMPDGVYPYEKADSWDKKLPFFLDFRIDQTAMSLEDRVKSMEERSLKTGRVSQEEFEKVVAWARKTQEELFDALNIPSYEVVTKHPEHIKARIQVAIKLGKFSEEEAERLRKIRVFLPKSGEDIDPAESVGMTQDEFLERLQLHPEDINDRLLQPERWERYIRRLYIMDAEEDIFAHMDKVEGEKWWDTYVRELYGWQDGIPYDPRNILVPNRNDEVVRNRVKKVGIRRAMESFNRRVITRRNLRKLKASNHSE